MVISSFLLKKKQRKPRRAAKYGYKPIGCWWCANISSCSALWFQFLFGISFRADFVLLLLLQRASIVGRKIFLAFEMHQAETKMLVIIVVNRFLHDRYTSTGKIWDAVRRITNDKHKIQVQFFSLFRLSLQPVSELA